jgi:hypothetical protein
VRLRVGCGVTLFTAQVAGEVGALKMTAWRANYRRIYADSAAYPIHRLMQGMCAERLLAAGGLMQQLAAVVALGNNYHTYSWNF